jgi:serine/threonine protein kinase
MTPLLTPAPIRPAPRPKEENLTFHATHRLYDIYEKQMAWLEAGKEDFSAIGLAKDVTPIAFTQKKDLVGEGVYAKVMQVYDLSSHRRIAMKFSNPEMGPYLKDEKENLKWIKAANCPNVAQFYYWYPYEPNEVAIAMELEKPSLATHFAEKGRFPLSDLLPITRDLLVALKGLAEIGMIHGDLSEDNIAYDPDEKKATLLDFGIAILETKDKQPLPQCFQNLFSRAPEVILGRRYDTRADLWSLAAVMYYVYIGRCFIYTHAPDENLKQQHVDLLHQIFAIIGPPPCQYVMKSEAPARYCGKRPSGVIGLKEKATDDIAERVQNIRQDPLYFEKRFHTVAMENGENPAEAVKLWNFLRLLLAYERPTAAEALTIFDEMFSVK